MSLLDQGSVTDRGPGPTDAAWVIVETDWSAVDLRHFIDDVERLVRLNPMLVIERLERTEGQRFRLVALNTSNGRDVDVAFEVERSEPGLTLRYDGGLKACTTVVVEGGPAAARLRITDDYSGVPLAEREARTAEVDLSLNAWGWEIRSLLRQWQLWGWLPGWRWYKTRVWMPLTPAKRRIVRLIWLVSALELAGFIAVVAIWNAM